jgi:hypothetical protein
MSSTSSDRQSPAAPPEQPAPSSDPAMRDDAWERARAIDVGWTEPPFASLLAVPGTSCRCTVSRQALSALAAVDELGPDDAFRVFIERRAEIEAIARWKLALLGQPRDNVIAVCSEDVRDHTLVG